MIAQSTSHGAQMLTPQSPVPVTLESQDSSVSTQSIMDQGEAPCSSACQEEVDPPEEKAQCPEATHLCGLSQARQGPIQTATHTPL